LGDKTNKSRSDSVSFSYMCLGVLNYELNGWCAC